MKKVCGVFFPRASWICLPTVWLSVEFSHLRTFPGKPCLCLLGAVLQRLRHLEEADPLPPARPSRVEAVHADCLRLSAYMKVEMNTLCPRFSVACHQLCGMYRISPGPSTARSERRVVEARSRESATGKEKALHQTAKPCPQSGKSHLNGLSRSQKEGAPVARMGNLAIQSGARGR